MKEGQEGEMAPGKAIGEGRGYEGRERSDVARQKVERRGGRFGGSKGM